MISKERLDFAVKQVVENCLKVKKGEKTCVITDKETKHIGLPIADKMKQIGADVKIFIMEDFGARPDNGSNSLKFPDVIKDFLSTADASVYAAQGQKGELQTFRKPMLETVNANKKIRHGHMINISDRIMEEGMCADYSIVQKISQKVYDVVSKASKIRVTTKRGTDFTASFNSSWKWVKCDGNITPGHWSNLPEGEVFTCPLDVNGKIIVDGILGDYMSEKFGPITKNPLYLEIKNGRVTSAKCDNRDIEKEYLTYIKQGENADRVGEFAIGTNIGLKELIGNLLQDEKFPGIHFAVGSNYKEMTGADWTADSHLDQIILNAMIEADGKTIMKDGNFLI